MKFIHLHTHSHYSLLDGLPKINQLVEKAKSLGMDSLALTDHGSLYGAIEFYKAAKKNGIKPIIGVEAYVAARGMRDKQPGIDDRRFHLVLLARNNTGYKNLIKLLTVANLEGFYYKPRVDKAALRQYSEGLIALSGCLSGEIPRAIAQKNFELAEKLVQEYKDIFGPDNFYLEIAHHPKIKLQDEINNTLIEYSERFGVPLCATCDAHYLEKEDAKAQDTLVAVQTGSKMGEGDRLSMAQEDFSFKSAEEMYAEFPYPKSALENTQKIADRCAVEIELGKIQLPHFPLPQGETADSYLQKMCAKKMPERYPNPSQEVKDRLAYELSVIVKTGFASYFLIVQDFVNWAKSNGVVVGPGRGSAAGSLISYILNITNVDPIRYNLLFERFLNPERVSMPDIDIDFADTGRDKVLAYVIEKYGHDRVAQIITFGTMAARAAVRDTGRALGIAYGFCDTLAKLIPFGMELQEALDSVAELKTLYETSADARMILDMARKLEGVARHASVHACGVVVSKDPLNEIVPLQYATRALEGVGGETAAGAKQIVTQYEMHAIEDLGLLKMDFLGLKNLSIIEHTLNLIHARHGKSVNMDKIPPDDKKTFAMLKDARTTGVFQLESAGMKRYLKELAPTEFEDIVAMVSLFRPGPMELIPEFIARKHKRAQVSYVHPSLEPILKNTYGIIIYQEQIMRIANTLAGFTLSQGYVLIKAVGKKIKSLLDEQRGKLIDGMVKNNIPRATAEKIWDFIEPFARYGFNRCITGDTLIMNPRNGKLTSVQELYQNRTAGFTVMSLKNNHTLAPRPVAKVIYNGKKNVSRIYTKSGRTICVTQNHPFLTPQGWKKLEDMRTGEKIAVPRILPEPKKPLIMESYKIGLLGYVLAKGNFCHPQSFYFYSKSKEEVRDYLYFLEAFPNTIGKIDESKSATAVYAKRIHAGIPSAAVTWIESLGLKYKKATEKFFPAFVYQLSRADLALLIGKMFQGDGCIHIKRKDPQIFYATSSMVIARELQHLLLRFGILSTVHTKKFKYRGGIKIGYTITISRYDNIQKFITAFGKHFVGQKSLHAKHILVSHPIINGTLKPWAARGSSDIIPVHLVQEQIREALHSRRFSITQFARETGISKRLFMKDKRKIGYLRETISLIAEKLNHEYLSSLAHSDIYWDTLSRIEPAGVQDTYDLTVNETHNFVANNIIVHNSHAVSYAMVGYQTAFLKAHFPAEFMAALMTSDLADIERVAFLVEEGKSIGIKVLPPTINKSQKTFSVIADKEIRFGMLAIKNVGENVVEAIIAARGEEPFASVENFIERVMHKDLNKKSLEALIKCGALDELAERNTLLANMDMLLEYAKEIQANTRASQMGLFSSQGMKAGSLTLKTAEPASERQKLAWEKELLGLYISGHPLNEYKEKFAKSTLLPIRDINDNVVGKVVKIGGMLSGVKKIMTKNNDPMAFANLRDFGGTIEVVVFPETLEKTREIWQENNIVLVSGKADFRNGAYKIICNTAKKI